MAGRYEEEYIKEGVFEAGGPGYECMVGDEKFTALLGTMHGRSVVDLIVTHATGLPGSTIESATIFTPQV